MEDNKRKLYEALSKDYDLGSFEQFSADIADETKRRKLYDATSEEYDYGDYDAFSRQLGFGAKQAPVTPAAPAQEVKPAETPAPAPSPAPAEPEKTETAPVSPAPQVEVQDPGGFGLYKQPETPAEQPAPLIDETQKAQMEAENAQKVSTKSLEQQTAEEVARYGTGNEAYTFEDAVSAGREYESLAPELEGFDAKLGEFNAKWKPLEDKIAQINAGKLQVSQQEYKQMQEDFKTYEAESSALQAVSQRYESLMNTAPGQEYKAISERMTALASGPKTPEAAMEYAQEYAKLQRNPIYRASLGDKAPSEDEIQSDLLQGQIAYLELKMKSAKGDEKKELKKAFSDAKRDLYANPYYQKYLQDKIAQNEGENRAIGEQRAMLVQQLREGYKAKGIDPQYYWQMEKGEPELQLLDAAAHMHDDAIREYKNPTKYDDSKGLKNVGKGLAGWASDTGTWSFGIENFAEDIAVVRPVLEKVQGIVGNLDPDAITDGTLSELEKKLTPGELAVLDAYFDKVGAQAAMGADTSIGYQIGQGIGDMVTLGLEMIATGGTGGVVHKLADKAGKKALATILGKRLYRKVAKNGVGRVALWGMQKVTSDIAETTARLPFMPSTYKSLGEGSVELNENNQLKEFTEYAPEKAFDQFVEQLTEVSQGFAFPLIGKVVKMPGMQNYITKVIGKDGMKAVQSFMERGDIKLLDDAMIGSFGGEWEEEFMGAVIHQVIDDKNALRDFFSAEQQLVLLGTLAPIPLARGSVGGAALAVPAARAAFSWGKAQSELQRIGLDEGRIGRIKEVLDNASAPEGAREIMLALRDAGVDRTTAEISTFSKNEARPENDVLYATVDAAGIDPQAYDALAHYFWAAQQKRAVGLMRSVEEDKKVAAKHADLEQRYGTFSHQYDGEEVVETATRVDMNGNMEPIFIVSDQANENGEMAYVSQNDTEPQPLRFVNQKDILNGSTAITPVNRYLGNLVLQDSQVQEAQGVVDDINAANAVLRQQVEALPEVTYNGMTGIVRNGNDETVTFVPDGPEDAVVVSWAELAADNGIAEPEVVSEDEKAMGAVDAETQRLKARSDLAASVREAMQSNGFVTIPTEEGEAIVLNIVEDTINLEDGTAQFVVMLPDRTKTLTLATSIQTVLGQVEQPKEEPAEPEPAPEPEPTPEPEPEVEPVEIPVDEKTGEYIYDAPGVTPVQAYDQLMSDFPERDDAIDYIVEQSDAINKEYGKAKAVVDKGENEKAEIDKWRKEAGEGPKALQARKDAAKAKVDERIAKAKEELPELERRKAFWDEMREGIAYDLAARNRANEVDMTPRSLDEAVAVALTGFFNGGGRLNYQDVVAVTGLDTDSIKNQGWGFVFSNKGISIDNFVHNVLAGDPETSGFVTDEQDAINKVGEMLQRYSRKQLGEYVSEARKAEKKAEEEEIQRRIAAEKAAQKKAAEQTPAEVAVEEVPEGTEVPEVEEPESVPAEPETPAPAEPETPEPTETEPTVPEGYGAKNKVVSAEAAAKAREIILRKLKTQLNTGFDPELFAAMAQYAAFHIEAGARAFADFCKTVIADLGDIVRPYLKSMYEGARRFPGMEEYAKDMTPTVEVDAADIDTIDKEPEQKEEKAEKTEENSSESAEKSVNSHEEIEARVRFSDIVANRLVRALETGEKPYKSINDLRKEAKDAGMTVEDSGATDVLIQEMVELGIVKAARGIVKEGGINSRNTYETICRLYEMQPTIGRRSSDRIAKQQYSTPLPMSFVAQMFAYDKSAQDVLEPTAGNGMLVYAIPADKVHANELDDTRFENLGLGGQPFKKVTKNDATEPFSGKYDAIVANPPFGSHEAVQFDGKAISGLDPLITLRALDAMNDNGRAAIIIGGNPEFGDNGAWKTKKPFFAYLYDHYNVKGVVPISGELYAKQGTTYPTMMILIDGRRSEEERAQAKVYPPVRDNAVREATTEEELYDIVNEIINDNRKTNGNQVVRTEGSRGPVNSVEQTGDVFNQDRGSESASDGADGQGRGNGRGTVVRSAGEDTHAGENQPGAETGIVAPGERRGTVSDVSESRPGEPERGETRTGGDGVQETVSGGRVDERGSREGNVGNAGRESVESVPGGEPTLRKPVRVEKEKRKTEDKNLPYVQHSGSGSLESVAPAAMVEAMDASLEKIEKEVGKSIDEFVMDELGYKTGEELYNALAAEQIDSVAMAIYQMKKGQAMIIGDQTGVGKGRQMAALIRWARRQGKKPIFMTQKASLFSDIYRDLVGIGSSDLKPLIINARQTELDADTGEIKHTDQSGVMMMEDENGKLVEVYSSPQNGKLNKIFESGQVPDEYDFVVLTYSQLNSGDEQSASENHQKMNNSKAAQSKARKAAFIRKVADGNYLMMDESHTAAGKNSKSGAFMRSIMPSVKGVTFSSATFAKTPETMPLYAVKSAMSEANVQPDELINMIKRGGVTLQEIMARALTGSGQMVRRERDMSDVHTDWKTIGDPATAKRARENYDRAIGIFNAIIKFQHQFIEPFIQQTGAEIAGTMGIADWTRGTENFGINNPPFVSQTYNFTKQLMLALKVDAIVDEVLKEIEAGRHPVIALENTYESGIRGYKVGDKIEDTSFSAGLLRSLEHIMQYTVTDEDGSYTSSIDPKKLGAAGEQAYYDLQQQIREATKDIFLSPIDAIYEKLNEKGYSVGEVTGRKARVVKTDDGYVMQERQANGKQVVADFNSGKLDVVIINKSGSTGISLHSSKLFKDQRQRSMIIAQPLGDINDYQQMIGRIDRTGQVHRGYYINLSLPVPAETRFNMMLAAKLKSLNANTTTSQESDTSNVEAPDFLNKYGSQVIIEYLRDNPELFDRMVEEAELKLGDGNTHPTSSEDLDDYIAADDDAKKVTGRVALLSVEEQERFYKDITERYNALIKYLDETGENTLKITTLPLKAKTLARKVGTTGKDPNGSNPFAQNSYVERVEVDVLKKPMKAEEIRKVRESLLGGKSEAERLKEILDRVETQRTQRMAAEEERYARKKEKVQKDIDRQAAGINSRDNVPEADRKAEIKRLTDRLMGDVEEEHRRNLFSIENQHDKLSDRFQQFNMRDTYLIHETISGNLFEGAGSPSLFLGFKTAKEGDNITPSTSFAVFATLDGRRRLEIKFTDGGTLDEISEYTNTNSWTARRTTIDNWDTSISNATREERYILTGNVLQAWSDASNGGLLPGRLVSYTDIDGNIKDGILMNGTWSAGDLRSAGKPINQAKEQINNLYWADSIESTDGEVEIQRRRGLLLRVPKTKKDGAKYFQDEDLLSLVGGSFYQSRGKFEAEIPANNLDAVLNRLTELGVRVEDENSENEWENVQEEGINELSPEERADEDGVLYRKVDDPAKIEELEKGKKVKVYRSMQVIDGKLYPPMSAKVAGKLRDAINIGEWEESEERPEMADENGEFELDKGDGSGPMKVAYAPYIHTRRSPLNEQFSSAYNRPNLVIVESEIPASELESGYTAERSKKSTGEHDWPSGKVSNALAKRGENTRKVILSRWAKPIRVVPNSEVADIIVGLIGNSDIAFPYNVVTPGLREELQKRSVRFEGWQGNKPNNVDELIAGMQPALLREGYGRTENLKEPITRSRAITELSNLAKALGVNFKEDSKLEGKGSFNPKTGQIRINIDAHDGTEDVLRTLLHEAVAHYGLRKLLGKDFKAQMQALYEGTSKGIQKAIDAIAEREGLSREVATEEYLADLAEDGRFTPEEETFWQKAWYAIQQLLRKIGLATRLTDADMRALLYASYRNLQTRGAVAQAQHITVMNALREQAELSHQESEDNGPEDDGPGGGSRRPYKGKSISQNEENNVPLQWQDNELPANDFYDARGERHDGLNTILRKAQEELESLDKESDAANQIVQRIAAIQQELSARRAKQQKWKEKYNIGDDGQISLEDLSAMYKDYNADEDLAELFEKVKLVAKQIGLDIKFKDTLDNSGVSKYNGRISFHLDFLTASGTPDFGVSATILHELIHSVTQSTTYAYRKGGKLADSLTKSQKKAVQELNAVFDELFEQTLWEDVPYWAEQGLQDADEMMAELANPSFRMFLMDVPTASGNKNFLQRIVDAIKRLFGFGANNMFDKAERALDRMLNNFSMDTFETVRQSIDDTDWDSYADDSGLTDDGINDLPEEVKKEAIRNETQQLYRGASSNATARTAATVYNSQTRTVGNAIKEVLVDEYAPVDALTEAMAEESGTPIGDHERVSDALRETGGRAMHAIREYDHKFLRPMWDAVGQFRKNAGISIAETERYIGLKSGIERNKVLAARDARRDYETQYNAVANEANAEIRKINIKEQKALEKLQKQLDERKISDVTFANETTRVKLEAEAERKSKQDEIDAAKAVFDAHVADIKAGTDPRFLEYRKKDYSAITTWAETDDLEEAEGLAQDYVDEMESRAGVDETRELWKRINAATKETLRFQYEHDMLSRQQYNDVAKMMQYYVPMRGFAEDTAEDLFNYYVTSQSNDFQATLLSAKGRKTMYEGPLGNIGAMHSSAISQGVKNQAKLALLNVVRNRKNNSLATVTRAWFVKTAEKDDAGRPIYEVAYPSIPEDADLATRERIIEDFEKDMHDKYVVGDAYNAHREVDLHGGVVAFEKESHKAEHIVKVREGGREYGIIINGNPAAAQAINGVKRGQGNGEKFLDIMRSWTRFLSQMFTTFSVPFWVSNFQRDHGQGLTNTFIRNDKSYLGRYILNRYKAFKVFPMIVGKEGLEKALAKGDPVAKLYQQYLENGGPMGQNRIEDNEYFERQMKRYLDNSAKQGVIGGAKAILDVIGGVGEAIETVTRFAVFMTSMEAGRPLHQSISDAKEVSTNFARKGSGRSFSKSELDRMVHKNGKPLSGTEKNFVNAVAIGVEICRATIPFFNAAVQGLQNKYVNYRDHTGKTLLADSIYLMLGLGMNLLLANAGGDDDKEKYSHTSDYLRRNNILHPLSYMNLDGVYAKWALPQEYRVMFAMGDIIGSAIREERPIDDLAMDAFGALMQLSPIGAVTDEVAFSATDKTRAAEALITNIAPGTLAPVFESVFNRDFKGARLYNEGFNENLKAYPGWTKALPTTGKEYVELTKFLNDITGGNDVERGWVNLNPAIVEHLVESYFSGPYQIVVRGPEAIAKTIMGEAAVRDIPLLNRIILNTNDNQRDAYYSNMYYYFKEKDTEAARIFGEYKQRGGKELQDFLTRKDYRYMLVFKQYENMEKAIRKQGKVAEQKGDNAGKEAADQRIQQIHEEIARRCLDIYFNREQVK